MKFRIYHKSTSSIKPAMVKKGKERGVQNLKILRTKEAFFGKTKTFFMIV